MRLVLLSLLFTSFLGCSTSASRKNKFLKESIASKHQSSKILSYSIEKEVTGPDITTTYYLVKIDNAGKELELNDSIQYTVTGDDIYIVKEKE